MRSLLTTLVLLLTLAAPAAAAVPGWSSAASLPTVRVTQAATLLDDGTVLTTGGFIAIDVATRSAERYDPVRDVWLAAGTMVTARTNHAAVLLGNGKVLVIGGSNVVGGALANAELYDPATNSWAAVQNMGTARRDPTATLLHDGKVLVTGGWTGGGSALTGTAELFDPATNSWSPTGTMGTPRALHAATRYANGDVLVTGGYTTGSAITPNAELYNATTGNWTPKAAMSTKRAIHRATLLDDGRVLVTAGGDGIVHLGTSEVYTPASNSWAPTTSMLRAHNYHDATLLTNGKVLVTGGVNAAGVVDRAAELYDPALNAWSSASSTAALHSAHVATLLKTGQVLVAGGDTASGYTAAAELWTPTTTILSDPAVSFDDQLPGGAGGGVAHITNTGDSPLLASRFALAGSYPEDFAITSDGCTGVAVAPRASCAVELRFAPGATGSRGATLTFEANTAAITHAVSLLGRGVAPPQVITAPPAAPAPAAPTQIVVTLAYVYSAGTKTTKLTGLMVKGVPRGSTITVTCRKGCARKSLVKRNVSGTVRLTGVVTKRLKVGVAIKVVVSKPGFSSAVKTLTIRKRKAPSVATQCQPPGKAKPGRC